MMLIVPGSNIYRLMNKCEPITSCVTAIIPKLCTEDLDLPLPTTNVFTIGLESWHYTMDNLQQKTTDTYILFTITVFPMKMHKQSI
jgi:hypothetical protein